MNKLNREEIQKQLFQEESTESATKNIKSIESKIEERMAESGKTSIKDLTLIATNFVKAKGFDVNSKEVKSYISNLVKEFKRRAF